MKNELNFLLDNSPEEDVSINAVVKNETICLTQKAVSEYDDFNKTQKLQSDFDKEVKRMRSKGGDE